MVALGHVICTLERKLELFSSRHRFLTMLLTVKIAVHLRNASLLAVEGVSGTTISVMLRNMCRSYCCSEPNPWRMSFIYPAYFVAQPYDTTARHYQYLPSHNLTAL